LTANVRNDTCFPTLQQYCLDVVFKQFKVIAMGGDNVFFYHNGDVDVMSVFNEAPEFSKYYLYDCRPLSKDKFVQYERWAWARCYVILIHAWNSGFFCRTNIGLREVTKD